MNELYLTIMFVVVVIMIILWTCFDEIIDYFIGFVAIFSLSVASVLMLILSGMSPIGKYIVEIKPATNTKVGNELIIQSEGWPTQAIDNIKFIDSKVQVKKTVSHNAWGGELNTVYQVELVD